jgi:WD40 repeat protein
MRTEPAQGLTFDPTGARVVTMSGAPVVWDVRSGTRIGALDVSPGQVCAVAVSPDGRRIAAPVSDGVGLFDADSGQRILTLPSPDLRQPCRLAFSADGSMLATQAPSTLGGPGIVRVWALDLDDLLTIARREITRPASAASLPVDA